MFKYLMKIHHNHFTLLLFIVIAIGYFSCCYAEKIYRKTDQNGDVIFSDQKTTGAQEEELANPHSITKNNTTQYQKKLTANQKIYQAKIDELVSKKQQLTTQLTTLQAQLVSTQKALQQAQQKLLTIECPHDNTPLQHQTNYYQQRADYYQQCIAYRTQLDLVSQLQISEQTIKDKVAMVGNELGEVKIKLSQLYREGVEIPAN